MSLRGSVVPAARRLSVGLLVVGFTFVAVQYVLSAILGAWAGQYDRWMRLVVLFFGTLAVHQLLTPFLAGIYVPSLEETDRPSDTLRSAMGGIRTYYWRLFASVAVALVVVGATVVFAIGLWLVLDTVLSYIAYASGDARLPLPYESFGSATDAATVGFVLAFILCSFTDVAAVVTDVRPRSAWRESLSFAQRRTFTFAGTVLVTAALLWISTTASGFLVPHSNQIIGGPASLVNHVGAFLLVTFISTLCVTFTALLRLVVYRRSFESTPGIDALPPLPTRGIALGAVLLVASIGGATYVRTADVGVNGAQIEPLPDDPELAYAVAASNTANASHRWVATVSEPTNETEERILVRRYAIDFEDRQRSVTVYENDTVRASSYVSEAVYALHLGGNGETSRQGLMRRYIGGWMVVMAPGYPEIRRGEENRLESATSNWSVSHANDSTIVYRIDDLAELPTADEIFNQSVWGTDLTSMSYAETVVDREDGVVSELHLHYEWSDTGRTADYVRTFSAVGTLDLPRPEVIGPRRPIEHLWDALYY